jgi:hypothetical protein
METAYHRESDRHFTVRSYKADYGPKLDHLGRQRDRPEVFCFACFHPMHTVGEDPPPRDQHWAHNPSPKAPWCPLKEPAAKPYQLLADGNDVSAADGDATRQRILEHWRQHWAHIQELAPMADIHTFVGFMRWAGRT